MRTAVSSMANADRSWEGQLRPCRLASNLPQCRVGVATTEIGASECQNGVGTGVRDTQQKASTPKCACYRGQEIGKEAGMEAISRAGRVTGLRQSCGAISPHTDPRPDP